MRTLFVVFLGLLLSFPLSGANIRIIESNASFAGHDMDLEWQAVATAMGHTVVISPQTTLDNNAFFPSADVLIVASGVVTLTATRVNTIQQFAQTGKSVYIQSEYLCNYSSNLAFSSIVNALGGTFTWGATTSGDLQPMTVTGTFATTPTAAPSLSYYWYGCYGTAGANVTTFLTRGGLFYGFVFCPPSAGIGRLITTTDQDWVRATTSTNLMRNIITHLLTPVSCAVVLPMDVRLQANAVDGETVALSWEATAEEGDLPPMYEIERSLDGGRTFERVRTIIEHGPEIRVLDQPSALGQVLHYRLNIVDGNGQTFYSNVATVALPEPGEALFLSWAPNPASPNTNIKATVFSGLAQEAQLELYDQLGARVLGMQRYDLVTGNQEIAFQLPEIAAGTYLIRLKTATAAASKVFVVE